MIKANKLMIGDLVEPHQCRTPTLYCKVEGIYPDNTVHLDKAERLFNLDELHPIPLTAEILEKNGFVRKVVARVSSNPYFVYVNDAFRYVIKVFPKYGIDTYSRLEIGEYDDIEYVSLLINYVHELQHVLRMCRIDLKIKLED